MLLIVLCNEVWRLDIGGHLPRVVLSAKTFPLNQELEPPLVPATVQYLFHLLLRFSINNNRWQQGSWLLFWYRIVQSGEWALESQIRGPLTSPQIPSLDPDHILL